MTIGDHLSVSRGLYTHHGIDIGRGRIIRYSGEPTSFWNAEVCITTRADFAEGSTINVLETPRHYRARQIAKRARSRLGERRYCLISNNCEHFALWCRSGEPISEQVERIGRASRQLGRVLSRTGNAGGPLLERFGDYLDEAQPRETQRELSVFDFLPTFL